MSSAAGGRLATQNSLGAIQCPKKLALAILTISNKCRIDALDHGDFGLNQSKIMNVINSNNLNRDAGGQPVLTSPHPALGKGETGQAPDGLPRMIFNENKREGAINISASMRCPRVVIMGGGGGWPVTLISCGYGIFPTNTFEGDTRSSRMAMAARSSRRPAAAKSGDWPARRASWEKPPYTNVKTIRAGSSGARPAGQSAAAAISRRHSSTQSSYALR